MIPKQKMRMSTRRLRMIRREWWAGVRCVRFWLLDANGKLPRRGKSRPRTLAQRAFAHGLAWAQLRWDHLHVHEDRLAAAAAE